MTQTLDAATPLAHALAYARLGWRVVPIPPGLKRPDLPSWQLQATTDENLITQWFTTWPTHGIGLVTGEGSGVFALDVDPAHGGDETLADLEAQHRPLPDTVEAITGGGGRHLLFAWPELPPGAELRNSAGRLGPGLDIRAEGGQIVVAPSVHPTSGRRYEWEASSLPGETAVATAPAWLIDLLTEDRSLPEGQTSVPGDHRFAWDAYEALGNAEAQRLLEAHGWHSPRTDREGVTYLVRPGKARGDGNGCAIGKVRPGLTFVFTSEAPPLEAEHGYRLPELYATLEHAGDRAAADAALCARSGLAPTFPTPRRVAELTAFYDYQRRLVALATPTAEATANELVEVHDFLAEEDDEYDWLVPGLLERGDRLILTGREGHGKSTLLRQLAVQLAGGVHPFELDRQQGPLTVLLLDLENSRRHLKRKLRALKEAAGPRLQRDHLYVIAKPEGIDLTNAGDVAWLIGKVEEVRPDVLITGPSYKMSDGDPTEELPAKAVVKVLDDLRARLDVAILLEAHTPSEHNGKSRLERPYGASLWRRWPEFGLFLDQTGALRPWRGARDEREWPYALTRGVGRDPWPWMKATQSDVTFGKMLEIQKASPKRLSVRAIADALTAQGVGKAGGPVSKDTVHRAIRANRIAWNVMLEEQGLEPLEGDDDGS